VGQALVPFYRQLLAVCNLYKNINVNLGEGIDPDRNCRIGDVIEDTLDYCYYLPIFVDGLADMDYDTRLLAVNGAIDLIMRSPKKVLPVLPKLILPLKRAFQTRDKRIIISALQVIQLMVRLGEFLDYHIL